MRILIVEDNIDHRELMSLALTRHDPTWQIQEVVSGEEALRCLAEEERYDLVFLDYSLPGRDGVAILAEIQRGEAPPPVVMVTGRGDEQVAVEAMKAGAYDYLVKGTIYLQRLPVVAQRAMEVHQLAIERKQAEEALAHERDLLHALMDNTPDSIYFKDAASRFTKINKSQAKILGVNEPTEAIGKTDFDFFTPEHAQDAYADEQRIVTSGQPLIDKIEEIRQADGQKLWVSTTKVPIIGEAGEVTGIIGITRNITERKRAEEVLKEYSGQLEETVAERTQELREAQEELIRQEKLATLGQLAGGVAHELRNPLGAIKNSAYFLNMILDEADPEMRQTLQILSREIDNSDRIIASLLNFARPREPILRQTDLPQILEQILDRQSVPEHIEVETLFDKTLPPVIADPNQLELVFGNLIHNAIQAMPEGGQLTIKSEIISEPDRTKWVAVSIADTGVGIPPENREKVFEPLFTTKAKGIGLGLALVKNLVAANRGSITVESEEGKGSTFTVKLPIK